MFPLGFPLRILHKRASPGDWILDPFSGRGTTNYAARLLGLSSVGIDSSPVAVALTAAKLANATPKGILACLSNILKENHSVEMPAGEFWSRAFQPEVLESVCRVRQALLENCRSDSRKALRAIVMGALHGPMTKTIPSYLSNQCTRTFAPKPRYAIKFWQDHKLDPPAADIRHVVSVRAQRYYGTQPNCEGLAILGDSRLRTPFHSLETKKIRWVITSPPYYGMRTYIPDQWLRNWFLGGPSTVDYSRDGQVDHRTPHVFAKQLGRVWENVASVATTDAEMIVRFGGIADRNVDPLEILKESFGQSAWAITCVRPAGSADSGRRQSLSFGTTRRRAKVEYDVEVKVRG